jgi:hypothetical protein
MSIAAVPDDLEDSDFSPEVARDASAALGQPPPTAVSAQPTPAPPPPVEGAPVVAAPPPPAAAEVSPVAAAVAGSPAVEKEAEKELGAGPKRPDLTGNPTQDVQKNVEYTRALQDRHDALLKKQGEIAERVAKVEADKNDREADEQARLQEERKREAAAYQVQRAARQSEIESAVSEKMASQKDLTNAGKDETFGMKLGRSIAIALGGLGQALMVKGGVHGAQNEGLKAVKDTVAQDYQRRKDRLAAASDAVLQARYGAKDAAEAHRAALNDLDADTAAKYRLIAAEAKKQLDQAGVDKAQSDSNIVVLAAQEEAAKFEGQIHAREEATQQHREQAAATADLAKAHLDQGERQITATEAQRRETNYEKRREFNIRDQERRDAAARAAEAKKEKQKDADDKEIVRDESGKPIGRVPTGRGGAQGFSTRDADYGRAERQLEELLTDVEKNDKRVLSPENIKRRETLFNNAVIGVATVSPLGKTNEAMEKEAGSLGSSGGMSLMGANPEAIKRKIEELKQQRNQYRQQTLRPLDDAGVPEARSAPEKTAKPDAHAELRAKADEADRKASGKPAATTKYKMPDGSIAEFDSSGKRVK